MAVGMLLQAVGLGWLAAIANAHSGYLEVGAALTVAGIGIALVFPTVSNEVISAPTMTAPSLTSATTITTCKDPSLANAVDEDGGRKAPRLRHPLFRMPRQ